MKLKLTLTAFLLLALLAAASFSKSVGTEGDSRKPAVVKSSEQTEPIKVEPTPPPQPVPEAPRAGEEINWQVISNGAFDGASTSFALMGTVGQTGVGFSGGGNYGLHAGYWQDFGGGGPDYVCGDCNADGTANITDAVYLITYIFGGGPPPNPLESGDANCDGSANITDAVYLIQYIFGGGPPPCDTDDNGVPDC